MKLELTFTADGKGHCLYSELLDLRVLGRLHCRRASAITFNDHSQCWEVRRANAKPDSHPLFSNPSREACINWEQEYLPVPLK